MTSTSSFLAKLAEAARLKWTTEPARTREDSLRPDKAFDVKSQADLDAAIRRWRAEGAAKTSKSAG